VQGDCYVIFGSIRDFVDADLIGDVCHFVLCIYSCCPHCWWARVVELRSFVDGFRQRTFQYLCTYSVEMPFSSMNPAYFHNTMCVCMVMYRAPFTRSPDQDELFGTGQTRFHSQSCLVYQVALPIPFIHQIACVVLARVKESILLPLGLV
jgi:hypothetical protein